MSRCLTWLGLRPAPGRGGILVTARLIDRDTGITRYELPYPVIHPCRVSRDGRLLVCATEDGGVEVWDVAPSPRWPAAVGTGLAVAGTILALGWWWRRSEA